MKKIIVITYLCLNSLNYLEASVYHEAKPLPEICYHPYDMQNPATDLAQCFAIADFEAGREMKTQYEFFKEDLDKCPNPKDELTKTYCIAAYIEYTGTYQTVKDIKNPPKSSE